MATEENVTGAVPFEGRRPGSPGFAGVYSAAVWAGHFKRSLAFDANDPNRGPFFGVWDMFDIAAVVGQRKITVQPGAGIIAGRLFYLENAITLDVPGGARKDRLIGRVYRSSAVNIVELALLLEVGGSGVYTPLTQSSDPAGIWEIPLWRWESPSGTGDLTTVSFIDDRYYANLSPYTTLEVTNGSGSDLAVGNVVVLSTGADTTVNLSTTQCDPNVLGVAVDPIVAGGVGKVARAGIAQVLVTGAVARGDYLIQSVASGIAQASVPTTGYTGFARALTANAAGIGVVWALLGNHGAPAAKLYRDANQSIGTSWTTVTFTTEIYDTASMANLGTSTSRIYCTKAGIYHLCGMVATGTAAGAGAIEVRFLQNAATAGPIRYVGIGTAAGYTIEINEHRYLAVGDYIELQAQYATYTRNINPALFKMTFMGGMG